MAQPPRDIDILSGVVGNVLRLSLRVIPMFPEAPKSLAMARARARPVVARATRWVKANPLVSKAVPTAIGVLGLFDLCFELRTPSV